MTFKENWKFHPHHFASVLSIAACFWLFFKYIRQMEKGVKHLLVVILAISDVVYMVNLLLENCWQEYFDFEEKSGAFIDSFSICFSIFWSAAIAFIAFKNLADRYIDLKKLFIRVLSVVFTLALVLAFFDSLNPKADLWMLGSLGISLILTIVFYQKSINILRDHLQYEQESISIYIRNLRYFSGVQLLAYGPLIVMNVMGKTFFVEGGVKYWIMKCGDTLASLSGFMSVVVFACQGGLDSDAWSGSDNDVEEDLTSGA